MSGHVGQAMGRMEESPTTAITDRAARLRVEGRDILSLSVGEPDFPTPPHVIEAAKQALDAGATRYTPVAGTAALREAAAMYFTRDLGIAAEPGKVIVTAGGKQAIFEAFAATLSEGDEVIVPAPWWVSYPQMVRFMGGREVPLACHPRDNFRFNAGEFEGQIGPRSKWLVLNSPNNPTGAVYPAEMLEHVGEVLRHHPQVMVLSDDIYAPLSYTGQKHATLAALCPDLADRILTVSGVSKSHAMTGFRIGLATGPEWLVSAMAKLQSNSSGNPAAVSQAAALAALEGPQEFLGDWREAFRARRDLVVSRINAIDGLSCPVPDGAFYAFIDAGALMPRFGSDRALVEHLLDHGVAVVPASAFGWRDGFRLSFAASEEMLDEALARIQGALA